MKNVLRWVTLGFIFSLPFSTKKLVGILLSDHYNYLREFSSAFVYATDVVALIAIALTLYVLRDKFIALNARVYAICVFMVIAALSVAQAIRTPYALYAFLLLSVAVLAGLSIRSAIRERVVTMKELAWALGLSAVFQSVVGLAQFVRGTSIGLKYLGEVVVTATTTGVARVSIGDMQMLRSYGTLPHANILAGFLVMGTLAFMYLYLTSAYDEGSIRYVSVASFFTILSGIITTFSRSGWIVFFVVFLGSLLYAYTHKGLRARAPGFLCAFVVSIIAVVAIFQWAIMPRAGLSRTEVSVDHRILYNNIGIDLLRAHPYGVGIAGQVLRGEQDGLYAKYKFVEPWLAQPIHNIYLLIADELGIIGLIAFLLMIALPVSRISIKNADTVFAGLMLASLLLFGLFDHYPWDLHAGRLMFFSMLGILMGVGETPS